MENLYNDINSCILAIEIAVKHLYDKENVIDNKDYWKHVLTSNKMDIDNLLNKFLKNF